jgi:CHASE2 domain-containing sensor protein
MLVTIILIILLVEGVILFFYGLQKQSQLFFFLGMTAFFIPVVYFISGATFLPLIPVLALIITYITKRKITLT